MPLPAQAHINGNRLWSTIEQSAEISKGRPGVLARLARRGRAGNWEVEITGRVCTAGESDHVEICYDKLHQSLRESRPVVAHRDLTENGKDSGRK